MDGSIIIPIASLIAIVFGFVLYLLPSVVAASRGHKQAAAIIVLNLTLGWTGLGWIFALIWALTATRRK